MKSKKPAKKAKIRIPTSPRDNMVRLRKVYGKDAKAPLLKAIKKDIPFLVSDIREGIVKKSISENGLFTVTSIIAPGVFMRSWVEKDGKSFKVTNSEIKFSMKLKDLKALGLSIDLSAKLNSPSMYQSIDPKRISMQMKSKKNQRKDTKKTTA